MSILDQAVKMLAVLQKDTDPESPRSLALIDNYIEGLHEPPYIPESADAEYKQLANRCITNWMPLLVSTPAQAMYVDGFKAGTEGEEAQERAWQRWQRSMMDSRQSSVHRAAIGFGHSFVVGERGPDGKARMRALSPLRTVAFYDDPASDIDPISALYVKRWQENGTPGEGYVWDEVYRYPFVLTAEGEITLGEGEAHGVAGCPVTRFTAYVDLEGRTTGVVEPMIPTQNRMNQSVFDLLVAQTYNSFEVRWATGMAVPVKRDPKTGEPELDENGLEQPLPIRANARRFLVAEDHETKFGSLAGTPLSGFVESIDMTVRHFAAMSQLPPHYLLGQVSNLSADALAAAEQNLMRMVEEFQKSFGESWERVFRVCAEIDGDEGADDFEAEVLWRDMGGASLSMIADALGKLHDQLEVPARGLWEMIPGVTPRQLLDWAELREEENVVGTFAKRMQSSVVDDGEFFGPQASGEPQVNDLAAA